MACAHAILLSLAGIPAIYFHSLFGSRGDAAAVRRTGTLRAINRQKLDRWTLEDELKREDSFRRRMFDSLCRLIRTRQGLASLHPQAPQRPLDCGPHVFALERAALDGERRLVCLHEVAGRPTRVRLAPKPASGHDVLAGEDVQLSRVSLAPYQARWIEVVP
jgi:sucrose phosphorylase